MDPIEEVEYKIAYLEKQLLELNDVVRELGDVVSSLATELRQLRERHDQDALAGHGHEPPPHY